MHSRRPKGQRGFTLVEVLVALMLLGLLSALLYGGLRGGGRAWSAVERRSSEIERIAAVQNFLRTTLAAHRPPSGEGADAGSAASPSFRGERDGFAFLASAVDAMPIGGPYAFGVAAAPDGAGGLALELRWRPAGPPVQSSAPAELTGARALLVGARAIRFGYRGAETGTGWRAEWPEADGAPALVAVDVDFLDADRLWPRFVAAIPTSVPAEPAPEDGDGG